MNHQIATYIDLIQSTGFIVLAIVAFVAVNQMLRIHRKENEVFPVKITVEK